MNGNGVKCQLENIIVRLNPISKTETSLLEKVQTLIVDEGYLQVQSLTVF